jgi:hypothetical protein
MSTELMRAHNRKFTLDDLIEIRKEAPLKRLRKLTEPNKRPMTVSKSTEALRQTEEGINVFEYNDWKEQRAANK